MDNRPAPSVPAIPSIQVHDADDCTLLENSDMFPMDVYDLYGMVSGDPGSYPCSQGLQLDHFPSNNFATSLPDLEEIPDLSCLSTMNQPFFTGHAYSLPHGPIQQEIGTVPEGGLSPSSFGSSIPSPTPSFSSSLSPSSVSIALSDNDSPLPPSPATPDQPYLWPHHGMSTDSLFISSLSNSSVPSSTPSLHRRSRSSPSRREPVASKAMLEANSRRRRHPAPFHCSECEQTFTALFSLKRHMQSHTGERPFACGIPGCTQRFYNSSDCKRHEKSKKRHKELATQ